jgi:hypothetical protein
MWKEPAYSISWDRCAVRDFSWGHCRWIRYGHYNSAVSLRHVYTKCVTIKKFLGLSMRFPQQNSIYISYFSISRAKYQNQPTLLDFRALTIPGHEHKSRSFLLSYPISQILHLSHAAQILFFLNWYSGGWSPTGSTRHYGHQWPIVPAPGDYNDGEIGGMIGRGNRSTRRKPVTVPLCPPQTPHANRTRTCTAAVGSQRLTAWLTARPFKGLQFNSSLTDTST